MKKCGVLLLVFLLAGCGSQETFETVADEIVSPVMAQPREITVRLPDNTLAPVLESESRQIYMSDTYEIVLEQREGGDLDGTIRNLSGYGKDALTVLQTEQEGLKRYETVWVSTGERGDRLGRAVILDDGQYHYCLSVLRDASTADQSQVVWKDVFSSFTLD